MEAGSLIKGNQRRNNIAFDEDSYNNLSEIYEAEEVLEESGSDKEWNETVVGKNVQLKINEDGPIRRSARKRKNSKFGDSYFTEENGEEEDKLGNGKKKRKGEGKKKSLKKKKKGSIKKDRNEIKIKDESSDEEGVLVIDDPNSYYDSDEYDSDGRLIRRDEIKRQQLEEERLQRKLKRKPNTPHLIKKYIPVPVHPDGTPIMPIQLRGLTIVSMGRIVWDKPKFHAKRYIWPAGFKSSRIYSSMTQLDKKCEYTSEIVDSGDEPSFVVTCWEDKQNPIIIARPTASGAWAEVGKRFFDLKKEVTGKDTYTQLSGPEMFGFAHPSIAKLIQEMPGAELCDKYIPQQFVPSSARIRLDSEPTKRSKRQSRRTKHYESDSDSEDYDDDEYEAEDAFDIKMESPKISKSSTQSLKNQEQLEEIVEDSGILLQKREVQSHQRQSNTELQGKNQQSGDNIPRTPQNNQKVLSINVNGSSSSRMEPGVQQKMEKIASQPRSVEQKIVEEEEEEIIEDGGVV